MSLHPSNNSVKGSFLREAIQPFLRRSLWWIMYLFASLGGLIIGWMFFSPTTPE